MAAASRRRVEVSDCGELAVVGFVIGDEHFSAAELDDLAPDRPSVHERLTQAVGHLLAGRPERQRDLLDDALEAWSVAGASAPRRPSKGSERPVDRDLVVVAAERGDVAAMVVRGRPDAVIPRCGAWLHEDREVPLSGAVRAAILERCAGEAARCRLVVALADALRIDSQPEDLPELTLLAYVICVAPAAAQS